MKRKTVESYDESEFSGNSIGKAFDGKNRKSVIIPLIASIIVAVSFWLFVTAENNTCSDVPVIVDGNERLMMNYNLSVASVEPQTVDIVLKGNDSNTIKKIINDKSLITARINVFAPEDGSVNEESCIFKKGETPRTGTFEVEVEVIAPSGITCDTKKVKVEVVETQLLSIQGGDITFKEFDYSLSKGYSIASKTVKTESIMVSGDANTMSKIDHIGLSVNWMKDIHADAEMSLTPIAYDEYGGVVDSKYLRFDPPQVEVYIAVNKTQKVALDVQYPEGSFGGYKLSPAYVTLEGPVSVMEEIGNVIVVNRNESTDESIKEEYTVNIADYVKGGENVRAIDSQTAEVLGNSFFVKVTPTAQFKSANIVFSEEEIKKILPAGYTLQLSSDTVSIDFDYMAEGNAELKKNDVVIFADLSFAEASGAFVPEIYFKALNGIYNVQVTAIESVTYTMILNEDQIA